MQVLVTGISGFVGRHVTELWSRQLPEATIWGFAREADANGVPVQQVFAVDLCDAQAVEAACHRITPDWVVHLAAQSFVPASLQSPQQTWEVNVWGTFHLLEGLRKSGFSGRFLFVGSGDQYGRIEETDLPIRETQPFRPRNPYAASKAAAELLCYQYRETHGMNVIVARSFNHTGPGQSPQFVMSDFARQVAEIEAGLREPVLAVGNLDVTRDFLDVRDVVEAYAVLLERGRVGEAYNVCSGREVRLMDLVQRLVGFSSRSIEIRVDPARVRPVDTPRMCGSHDKLTRDTGWRPTRDLVETLRNMVAYWQERVA